MINKALEANRAVRGGCRRRAGDFGVYARVCVGAFCKFFDCVLYRLQPVRPLTVCTMDEILIGPLLPDHSLFSLVRVLSQIDGAMRFAEEFCLATPQESSEDIEYFRASLREVIFFNINMIRRCAVSYCAYF